jgi:hypothetical protein
MEFFAMAALLLGTGTAQLAGEYARSPRFWVSSS